MAAYVIAQITVTDPEQFQKYGAAVSPTVEAFGGEYVVRGGECEVFEGAAGAPRLVIIKFPSREVARTWWNSPDYAEAKAVREGAATMDVVAVEGV